MQYRIYPPIGIARLGNTPDRFYIGPEIPGHPGFEPDGQGGEAAVEHYKVDEDEVKRQAARFRLFEIPDGSTPPRPAQLPAGATIEWTVHLVNKKSGVQRAGSPSDEPERPQLVANSAPLVIDPKSRTVAGANASPAEFDTGEYKGRRVPLGEIRTDKDQNLLVLGGFGFSSSPTNAPLPSFYTNPGWHDDSACGPVTARIKLANGSTIDDIVASWVMVGPPDFAPEIQGVVTLFDILQQVAIDNLGLPEPAPISFTKHVFPLLFRTRRLQWVNGNSLWSTVSDDWPALADASAGATQLRKDNARRVRKIESSLLHYSLTSFQKNVLTRWEAGDFISDWTGLPVPGTVISAEGLTRAALDSTVGQGFFPGIEGGILMTDSTLYSTPFEFRIDQAQVKAGDLTALMAVPWQADFLDCGNNWWPTQRPNEVRTVATSGSTESWSRGVTSHLGMVNNFSKLAFITAQKDSQGNIVFAEEQRAGASQFA